LAASISRQHNELSNLRRKDFTEKLISTKATRKVKEDRLKGNAQGPREFYRRKSGDL
jgi:hypothetical protein